MKKTLSDFPGASYVFDTSAKTITFSGLPSIILENVLMVTNMTTGDVIFDGGDNTLLGTVSNGNILTLQVPLDGMVNTNKLQIHLNMPDIGAKLGAFISDSALKTILPVGYSGRQADILSTGTKRIRDTVKNAWVDTGYEIDSAINSYLKQVFEYLKNPERIDVNGNVRVSVTNTPAVTITSGTVTTVSTVTTVTTVGTVSNITNLFGITGTQVFDVLLDQTWGETIRTLLV